MAFTCEAGGRLVVKFGGTSLGTAARVRRAARRLAAVRRSGREVIAVVSAAGNTTEVLLRRLAAVGGTCAGREQDRALATGETLSAAVLAATLIALGIPACSLDAIEAGIEAEGEYGKARPVRLIGDRIARVLAAGAIPVVAGFQALRADGERVTLGRGGSDTTAVFLAAAFSATCHIVTDVDGVYDCDPRTSPTAVRFPAMTHEALARLTGAGAEVVHPEAARIALHHAVPLVVRHHAAGHLTGTRVGGGVS